MRKISEKFQLKGFLQFTRPGLTQPAKNVRKESLRNCNGKEEAETASPLHVHGFLGRILEQKKEIK